MEFIKSPLNYTGGKFKLLPKIMPLFDEAETFIDLFGGGGNVGINSRSEKIIINDREKVVIDFFKKIQKLSIEDILESIKGYIENYDLSKVNQEGFLKIRKDYNASNEKDPLMFYTMLMYSFNYQIRFNSKGEYNMPFGKDRSSFNKNTEKNIRNFHNAILSKKIIFTNNDFRDIKVDKINSDTMVYCDPPYLITTASYNENGGWTEKEEIDLLNLLDEMNDKGIKFALSNVLEHKGEKNDLLIEWSKKYTTHFLSMNYNNSNYQSTASKSKTVEVLITNYDKGGTR